MSPEQIAEASEREIERIMNEEAARFMAEELEQADRERPMTHYEKSKVKTAEFKKKYGDDPEQWPEGVRPADQAREQALFGEEEEFGNQDYEGNIFDMADEGPGSNINQIRIQDSIQRNVVADNQVPDQIRQGGSLTSPVSQVAGDAEMDQADFQAKSEAELIEDQILQQILEESKGQ